MSKIAALEFLVGRWLPVNAAPWPRQHTNGDIGVPWTL
jgi:hypothetical protein